MTFKHEIACLYGSFKQQDELFRTADSDTLKVIIPVSKDSSSDTLHPELQAANTQVLLLQLRSPICIHFSTGQKQPLFSSLVPHISVSKVQDEAVFNRVFVRVHSHEQADRCDRLQLF